MWLGCTPDFVPNTRMTLICPARFERLVQALVNISSILTIMELVLTSGSGSLPTHFEAFACQISSTP
jgi:hypothetical protein